jgi:hypothetical protein
VTLNEEFCVQHMAVLARWRREASATPGAMLHQEMVEGRAKQREHVIAKRMVHRGRLKANKAANNDEAEPTNALVDGDEGFRIIENKIFSYEDEQEQAKI